MKNKKIQLVSSEECFITNLDSPSTFCTACLNDEIAVSIWSKDLNLAVLGRCLTKDKIHEIFKAIKLDHPGIYVEVKIVGGNNSPESRHNEEEIIQAIHEIDHGLGMFHIRMFTDEMIHPNFCILNTGAEWHPGWHSDWA